MNTTGRTDAELVAELVETTEHLGRLLQRGYGVFQLETLLAIKEWALAQQPVQTGDRVVVTRDLVSSRASGWWGYRELLDPRLRNEGVVESVDFNAHWKVWQASVRFDAKPDGTFSISVSSLRTVRYESHAPTE